MIFYKNSLTLNVYLKLNFFTYWLKLILTFPNSLQDSLGKVDGGKANVLSSMMHWKYREDAKTDNLSSKRKVLRLFTFHFCFFFHNAWYMFWKIQRLTVRRFNAISTPNGLIKAHYRGFSSYFCDDCRH